MMRMLAACGVLGVVVAVLAYLLVQQHGRTADAKAQAVTQHQLDTTTAARDLAVEANAAQQHALDAIKESQQREIALAQAVHIVVERHITEEIKTQAVVAGAMKERTDAHLADGPASDDLRLAYRGMRRVVANYNQDRRPAVPGADAPQGGHP